MNPSKRTGRATRTLALGLLLAMPLTPALVGPMAHAGEDDVATTTEVQADPTSVNVGYVSSIDSFNPFVAAKAFTRELYQFTYDYLTEYDTEDLTPAPALAEKWEVSDDGLVWTFQIREGVKWSDGEALTASDIAWTFNQVVGDGPGAGAWGSYLKGATSVEAPDDTTVVITFEKPNAVMPYIPIPILPEHVWGEMSEEEMLKYPAEAGPDLVTSGPFRMTQGTATGSTISYEANPDYWAGAPEADRFNDPPLPTRKDPVQGLITGDIDFAGGVSPLQLDALANRDNIETKLTLARGFDHIGFNTGAVDDEKKEIGDGNEVLEDPKFRHALGYAIDREVIANNAYRNAGQPGQSIIPASYPAYAAEPEEGYTFDPEKAGQLLDEAGYTEGPDGTRQMPDGTPIGTLRLYADSGSEKSVSASQYIEEWFTDIGLPTKMQAMDTNRMTDEINAGNYDIFHWGWAVRPDPDAMLSFLTCGAIGSTSDTFYCNEAYDDLYAQQQVEMDHDKRVEIIKDMQQMVWEEAPYQVLVHNKTSDAWRSDRIEGFVPRPAPDGSLLLGYGASSLRSVHTIEGADSGRGLNTTALVAGGIGLVVLAGGAAALVARNRKQTADDRECRPPPGRVAGRRGVAGQGHPEPGWPVPQVSALRRSAGPGLARRHLLHRGLQLLPLPRPLRRPRPDPGAGAGVDDRRGGGDGGPARPGQAAAGAVRGLPGQPRPGRSRQLLHLRAVTDILLERIPPTLALAVPATIIGLAVGFWIGMVSAWRRGSRFDRWTTAVGLFLYAMPAWWLGLILLAVFAVGMGPVPGIFPTGQLVAPGLDPGSLEGMLSAAWHLVLPVLTLSLALIAGYALIMRSSLLEEMGRTTHTARAKGLQEIDARRRHAVPNAMLPTTTMIALSLGSIVTGSITIETIFSIPGIGLLTTDALAVPDYPLLQGIFLLTSGSVIVANLIANLLYGWLDPRVRA